MSKLMYTALLSHISKIMFKILQARLQSVWTNKFQMYKLHLGKAEEPEIKWPTSAGWNKKQDFQKNIHFVLLTTPHCFIDYTFDLVDYNKLWTILQEMGIPDRLTYFLTNLYAGQEATVRTGYGATEWFRIGKGVRQSCILSPCLFNLYAEYIMEMLSWMKHKLESRLLGEISITLDMQMTPPLWQKAKKN